MLLITQEYEVAPSDFDESVVSTELPPVEYVSRSACRKAEDVAEGVEDAIVIGADTVVVVDGQILGKPTDEPDARRMLRLIGGRTHSVYTGVCLLSVRPEGTRRLQGVERTEVKVRPISDSLIDRYIATGEPTDKAGGYAIQGKGAVLIEHIDGCYFNVVGLPVFLVSRLLEELGVEILA